MKNIIILLFVLPFISFSQSVKGTFSPAKDYTFAFLYEATPESANYINRGQLDSLGNFEIQLDSTVKPGIYKIVYAVPPEENNFDFIYNGKETVAFNFSQENGVNFTASEENKLWNSYLKSIDMVNQTISNYYAKSNADQKGFKAIFKTLKDTQTGYEELAQGKLVLKFITANRPYIPNQYENISLYSKNLKAHYLNQVDFSDYLLQSSTFLIDRVTAYVFNMVENPSNTTYKQHIDDVAAAISDDNAKIKTSLLEKLWQRFVALENLELANFIADNYLLELAKKTENRVLHDMLISFKNTSIGSKAPNFDITLKGNKTSLHQLDRAEHYLLIFWSSSCSHCLEELPKVRALIAGTPNLKVVAFGLEENEHNWKKEIANYPDFIHKLGLNKWDNPTVITYGISITPTYFLLDSSKVISAKPYGFEELSEVLKAL
ncbi:TlpA family protein disulfide reductase [Winogradskyella bathintestinalis]|uniref:Thioredoxin-like domain-containing protein n=1 Tax=Winogradskyella bathintestinalis TaxID=3035208 RepID=A0ABT7ZQS5_9FLAO|nr:thioredoxin-like domain-containing protein [Winogradskyella bathintestinalis]MDN3491366.1 thioredoxin-like domain-containing protein [Winogradskyella bathintestinalis]